MMTKSNGKERNSVRFFCHMKNGRGRSVAGTSPLGDGCKPDSVRPMAFATGLDGHLSCPAPCGRGSSCELRLIPGGFSSAFAAERAGGPVPPVLSCTTWGFSCPLACARGGGLLPRLFTLAAELSPGGGLFSVTLSVGWSFRFGLPRILRGMLPYGVRTFLSPRPCGTHGATVRHQA